jgi:hypothetical protein
MDGGSSGSLSRCACRCAPWRSTATTGTPTRSASSRGFWDSGAFTEITRYGEWRYDPDRFGGVVTRILDNVGTPPVFCAVQDMPCEPRSLAASGLAVPLHQGLTTESVCYLRSEFRHVPWIPILQGWRVADYVHHVALYQKAGIDLTWEPVGSQIRLHFLIDHFISTSFMKRW